MGSERGDQLLANGLWPFLAGTCIVQGLLAVEFLGTFLGTVIFFLVICS